MPKSKIIYDLVEGNVSLDQSLKRLQALALDLGNEELITWIKNELNGYSKPEDIPDYRKTDSISFEYSGINGRCSVKHASVSLSWIDSDELERIINYTCSEPISYIEQCSKSNSIARIDRSILSEMIASNTDNAVICTSIYQLIPQSFFLSICNEVYDRILETLVTLEQQFGILDQIGIELNNADSNTIKSINQKINDAIPDSSSKSKSDESIWLKIFLYAVVPLACVLLGAILNNVLD